MMKRWIKHIITTMACAMVVLTCTSCHEEDEANEQPTEQTIFMFLPWSGSGIYSYLLANITAFEQAITNNHGLDNRRLLVFLSSSETEAQLLEITFSNNQCRQKVLHDYTFSTPSYTTAPGITQLLQEVVRTAPAQRYAMLIGGHGMGWLPRGTNVSTPVGGSLQPRRLSPVEAQHPEYFLTRFFGHSSDEEYQIEVSTLADGIKASGLTMEYILFDDCYMSNIETAYDLREVTRYLIASTSEIMIMGMPYATIGVSLLHNDYASVCQGFYNFYSTYARPCGTIAVTDCHEAEATALLMKDINRMYATTDVTTSSLQDLDGITPTIFYDFGDYANRLAANSMLLPAIESQLQRLVPYKAATPTYYSDLSKQETTISTFSGLTISDPSQHPAVSYSKTLTQWYQATH